MFLHQCNVDVEKIRSSPQNIMTVFFSRDDSQSPHNLLSCLLLLLCPTQLNLDQSEYKWFYRDKVLQKHMIDLVTSALFVS